MTSASTTVIALLRGINVGGHNKLPMAQLRDIAADVGFIDARTYIQSGNLVAATDLDPEVAGDVLAVGIREATGLRIPIIVRTAQQWADLIAANPFAAAPDQGTKFHVDLSAGAGIGRDPGVRRVRVRPGFDGGRRVGDLPVPPRRYGPIEARCRRESSRRCCGRYSSQLEHRVADRSAGRRGTADRCGKPSSVVCGRVLLARRVRNLPQTAGD